MPNIFNAREAAGSNSEDESDPSESESETEESETTAPLETEGDLDEENDDSVEVPIDGLQEESALCGKVRAILEYMVNIELKLADFLDALSWGDNTCTLDAKIQAERWLFLASPKLLLILRRWTTPPRMVGSKKARPKGANQLMTKFSFEHVQNTTSDELESLAPYLISPQSEDVEKATLEGTSFQNMLASISKKALYTWDLLKSFAMRPNMRRHNARKDSDKVIILIISMLSYTRSHHRCHFQKLLAIYLKFKGISAKGFNTLHAMALTMSNKWTSNAVERISESAMKEVLRLMEFLLWFISHDNVQIPFRVFSQCLDNKDNFGNGTAATVYLKRNARPLSAQVNQDLKHQRAIGMKNPITELDIIDLAVGSMGRIQTRSTYEVLRFLLESHDFDIGTYHGRKSDRLKPPPPVNALPCGQDHITLQYLLGSANIPEASYEDNQHLINEWFNQLGWTTPEKRRTLATKKVIAWVGDQLTVDRLRGLFKFHAEDDNSFERLDFTVIVFGWLHLQMVFANSLHKQYLGSNQGRGLKQSFEILGRKGLTQVQTKGPFHHNLEEALCHIADFTFSI